MGVVALAVLAKKSRAKTKVERAIVLSK